MINGQDRINNHAEAAYRRLHLEIRGWASTGPQKERDLVFEQMVAGNPPPMKWRKYLQADDRILVLVQDFANRPIMEYLHRIAHNFEMND